MRERTDRAKSCGCAPRATAEPVAERPVSRPSTPGVWRRSSYSVRPEAVAAIRDAVRTYVEYVGNHERDTWSYAVIQPADDATAFVHAAAFKDQAALVASQSSAAYQTFVGILRPVLVGEVRVETTDGAAVAEAGSRVIASTNVSVQVRLVVRKRSDLPRFQRLVIAFTNRPEQGLLSSDAFRDPSHERIFFIYERWSSQAALDAAMGGKLQMELLDLAVLTNEEPFSIT